MKINKKLFLFFCFLMTFSSVFSQKKVWIDENWNSTTVEKARYYKTSVSEEGILSYYFKNGKIAKKESYENGVLEGDCLEYYETGELKKAGKYEKGKKEGVWKTFYKNGKIKIRGKYRDGEKVGVWKTFYKNVY